MRVANLNRDNKNQGAFRATESPYGYNVKVVITCKHVGNYDDAWVVSAVIYDGKSRYVFKPVRLVYAFGCMGSPEFNRRGVGDDEVWSNYCESAVSTDPQEIWGVMFSGYGTIEDFGKLDMLRSALYCVSEDICSDSGYSETWSPYRAETKEAGWHDAPEHRIGALAQALELLVFSLPEHM